MAGNLQADNSGNILVEFDYNNIIIVDPNKTIDAEGNVSERLVDHENLVMYANLEAELLPRTKLAVGASPEDRIRTISIAKINFLKPTKNNYMGTGYYDELTGKDTTTGRGVNQPKEIPVIPKNGDKPYVRNTVIDEQNVIDNGLLGMTSISIKTSTSFIPTVTIDLEDVQGKALFQLGNNSPYAAFFNLPYPPFYLTIKGYYGQAIRYQLNLETFNARFNSFSGNYQVTLQLKGYKFNILNEISMANLLATPHMYSTTYNQTQSTTTGDSDGQARASSTNSKTGQGTTSDNNVSTTVVSERGYQKIVEVYSEYKSKLLIPLDFPELTLVQLMNKLQNFINGITNSYIKVDVEPLTNIRNYKDSLKRYFERVKGEQTSWFKDYLDPKPIVLKDGSKVYFFKQINDKEKDDAVKELKTDIIKVFNDDLAANPTLGTKGTSPITNEITYEKIEININISDVNWEKTVREQTGILQPTTAQTKDAIYKILNRLSSVKVELEFNNGIPSAKKVNLPKFFIFQGKKRFDNLIATMEAEANKKLSQTEQRLTLELASKIEDKSTGIGFKPTVRNITAVIMASAEAFIRLMDDVHTNSWNQKYNPVRKRAILDNPSSAPGSDTDKNVKVSQTTLNGDNQYASSQEPVYPWPQFFVETPEDKKGRFQLRYIADPTVVDLTQGWNYVAWPEVEFVEEFMKGLTQKLNPPIAQPPTDSESTTIITNINAIEFPNSGIAYVNKEQLKFFYEIWERQFLSSFYSGFIRTTNNSQQVQDITKLNIEVDGSNIKNSLGVSSPFLALALKEYKFTAQNYVQYLSNFSNQGTGRSYQDFIRDFFVTPYIKTLTENSFSILNLNDLGRNPENLDSNYVTTLETIIKQTINEPFIVDTLPFTDYGWNQTNLSFASLSKNEQVYNTNKVLKVLSSRSVISNFTDTYNYTTNRPVTNFSYLKVNNPIDVISSTNLQAFYSTREPKDFVPTEGYVEQTVPNRSLPSRLSTSILNTPYFINAIQNGVYNWRRRDQYPYIQAAYLFINSLPLASLRERYKTYDGTNTTDLDYIASCFKKFGAIHKMPYSWVLKMGSIWHRYKKYKESNIDILTGVWDNFDYTTNYDPITKSKTKEYSFKMKENTKEDQYNIILQTENQNGISIQTGFYPKVINDFNVFYNGYDLYQSYSNEEIQKSVNNGMVPYSLSQLNGTQQGKQLALKSYSVLLKDQIDDTVSTKDLCAPANTTNGTEYFIVPSLGATINQTQFECFVNNATVINVTDNQSMYNGSVRLLWAAPNYGYFDNSEVKMPKPDSYLTKIESETNIAQSPLYFFIEDKYTNIEEVFSIFDKTILNNFEQEFLNFCKPITDIELGLDNASLYSSTVDINANFRNFQALFRILMKVQGNLPNTPYNNFFTNSINNQLTGFSSKVRDFLQYDVLLKYGNPSNYRRRIFDSYLNNVVDPIQFEPYVPNSLPSARGGITLSQSKANYPQEWKALETEVGFSTIPNVIYTDRGSYITDFFIDNNIKFTVSNIGLLSPIIKMYATQKLKNPALNSAQFKTQLQEYLNRGNTLQNGFLNGVLEKIRKDISDVNLQVSQRTIQSVIDGQQSKIENYEVFKALNDKWIAGGDFKNKTLFEDILFLDRASRNIGDTIVLDIFDLQNMLNSNSLNETMSVFTFLSGILIKNNFTVMPLPAYINFYSAQDVDGVITPRSEGTLDFANNMWGTFLNVDYRNSGPKMIAFYVGKTSEYLDLPKGNFRFRDDGFEMRRASENPLIEDQQGKKDWAVSNKCVGFNVDIGTRNQNVFYNFTISQDSGKATSESIQAQLNMIDQANGRQISTQNNGLYNFYKQRSYQCSITCLGNALLQPMMYFNLRHVPMFYGPYMIMDVSHVITPGTFETTVTGIRQSVYDLPVLDNFLQSINRNLLTKIEALTVSKKDQAPASTDASTNNTKSSLVVQSAGSVKAAPNTCESKMNPAYSVFEVGEPTETPLTPQGMRDAIVRNVSDPVLRTIIYCICYVRTFINANNQFVGFNNNFATLPLTESYGARNDFFFPNPKYVCLEVKNTTSTKTNTLPTAVFSDVDKFIRFMRDSLQANVSRILEPTMGLRKYYVCYWSTPSVSETYYDQNISEFETVIATFDLALNSAKSVGFIDVKRTETGETVQAAPPGVTPTPTPTIGTSVASVSITINCTPTPTPSATRPINTNATPAIQPQTVKTEESQPQQTGPVPLIATYIKNPILGGDENLTVKINPELKDYEIFEITQWSWQAVKSVVSNNQTTQVVVQSRINSRELDGNISANKQEFYVSDFNIINLVEKRLDEGENKQISSISSNITLIARSKNKFTKFNETKNSNDVIEDSYQNFRFLIILK